MKIDDAVGPRREDIFGKLLEEPIDAGIYEGSVQMDGPIATDRRIAYRRDAVIPKRSELHQTIDCPRRDEEPIPVDEVQGMWSHHIDREYDDARVEEIHKRVPGPEQRVAAVRIQGTDNAPDGLSIAYLQIDRLRLAVALTGANRMMGRGPRQAICLTVDAKPVALVMILRPESVHWYLSD